MNVGPAGGSRAVAEEPVFFLSDPWIGTCLETWPGRARFERMEVPCADGYGGHVLIGRGVETRHRLLRIPVIAINESTHPLLDETTIELNGIIDRPSSEFESGFRALLPTLQCDGSWGELRFSGLPRQSAEQVAALAEANGLRTRLFRERPTYWVDLDLVRQRFEGDYLASRSSNTREQLRRSLRAAKKDLGEVALRPATSTHEALRWLDDLAPLHRARWPSRGQATGFDNKLFVEFHRRLITRSFDRGAVELLRLDAGDACLAYLYNFRWHARTYFYLSAIDYARAERYRPGMLAHWLAIERALASGDRSYDLLAGEHVYKERLATHQDLQRDLVLWRPRMTLRLENTLRGIRRRWRYGRLPKDKSA